MSMNNPDNSTEMRIYDALSGNNPGSVEVMSPEVMAREKALVARVRDAVGYTVLNAGSGLPHPNDVRAVGYYSEHGFPWQNNDPAAVKDYYASEAGQAARIAHALNPDGPSKAQLN